LGSCHERHQLDGLVVGADDAAQEARLREEPLAEDLDVEPAAVADQHVDAARAEHQHGVALGAALADTMISVWDSARRAWMPMWPSPPAPNATV
jgi:hypothetical protein